MESLLVLCVSFVSIAVFVAAGWILCESVVANNLRKQNVHNIGVAMRVNRQYAECAAELQRLRERHSETWAELENLRDRVFAFTRQVMESMDEDGDEVDTWTEEDDDWEDEDWDDNDLEGEEDDDEEEDLEGEAADIANEEEPTTVDFASLEHDIRSDSVC